MSSKSRSLPDCALSSTKLAVKNKKEKPSSRLLLFQPGFLFPGLQPQFLPEYRGQVIRHDPMSVPAGVKRLGRDPAGRVDKQDVPPIFPVIRFRQRLQLFRIDTAERTEDDDLGMRTAGVHPVQQQAVSRDIGLGRLTPVVRPVVDEYIIGFRPGDGMPSKQ